MYPLVSRILNEEIGKAAMTTVTDLMQREPVPDLPPAHERVKLRKINGLTQEQLANALQINVRSIRRWEKGIDPRGEPRVAYARLLAKWKRETDTN